MNNSPISGLHPLNDCVLVELDKPEVAAKEGRYDTRTNGIVIAVPKRQTDMTAIISGRRVYFEEYKEGGRIKRDGKLFCFIKIEDIRGFEDVS